MKRRLLIPLLLCLLAGLCMLLCACNILDLFLPKVTTAQAATTPASTSGNEPGEWSITYINAGQNGKNPVTYSAETLPITLQSPEKEGYDFAGWTGEGVTEPTKGITIPEGMEGNLTLTAHWQVKTYTITYELGEGEMTGNPDTYTVESETFTLQRPNRDGYSFAGWTGTGLSEPTDNVTIEKGSVGNRTYTACWEPLPLNLTYSASDDSVHISYRTSGEEVILTAPGKVGDLRFVGWTLNGADISVSPVLRFVPGPGSMAFVAMYAEDVAFTYDKKTGGGVAATLTAAVTEVRGGGLTAAGYTLTEENRKLTLLPDYLQGLASGTYTYLVTTAEGDVYLYVTVTDSRTPTDLYVEYDAACYPDVKLHFACTCGGAHTYSLDGGTAVACADGDVIGGYDKSVTHTLTVTCAGGGSATCTTEGWTAESRTYYEQSFTYGGRTFDFVPDTTEEFEMLLQYLALVKGVEDCTAANAEKTETYHFWVAGEVAGLCATLDSTTAQVGRALTVISLPMTPQYSVKFQEGAGLRGVGFTYKYGFNSEKSSQTVRDPAPDLQGLLIDTPTRPQDFDGFAINNCATAVEVRTLYELECLPYGCKPVFSDTALSQQAKEVYDRACEILRDIISDDMTAYEKVAAIYSWLALNVTYDHTAAGTAGGAGYRAYTVYGALIDRLAVCDGFGSGMRLLCQIEGIRCEEVTGLQDRANPSSGHAWNKVEIDGVWYGVDATWAYSESGELGFVNMSYLFMNEADLIEVGHYENERLDDDLRYTAEIATSVFSWFDLVSSAPGYDRNITTVSELFATVKAAHEAGVQVVTLRCEDSLIMANAQDLMRLIGAQHLNRVTTDGGVILLSFTFETA